MAIFLGYEISIWLERKTEYFDEEYLIQLKELVF